MRRPNWLKTTFVLLTLLAVAVAQGPPVETGPFRTPDLVELIKLDPTIRPDIRYATKNNFPGKKVYKQKRAFLQRPVAEALVRVNQKLRPQGYGVIVFDGYRFTLHFSLWVEASFNSLPNPFKRMFPLIPLAEIDAPPLPILAL